MGALFFHSRHNTMPHILAIGTALPSHRLEQQDIKQFARDLYGEAYGGEIERLLGVYDHAQIERRHFCVPKEWFASDHPFSEKNRLYIQHALELSKQAIEQALNVSQLDYTDIDYLLFVSTTGLSTPSMDAQLLQALPFRRNVKRLPIWGLGCAGGAASLARAMEIAQAVPTARILVVVVELCGLTFMRNDLTKAALIATSLFGDGAAAVVIAGNDSGGTRAPHHPALLASQTNTLPDSLDVMGWAVTDAGFRIVMSRDIPSIVRTFMVDSITDFLHQQGITRYQIQHYVAHPGGAKVIQAYEESLHLPTEALRHTRTTLREAGNMSACSVLFVLQLFMQEQQQRGTIQQQEYGIVCALGPGFIAELLLLRWG